METLKLEATVQPRVLLNCSLACTVPKYVKAQHFSTSHSTYVTGFLMAAEMSQFCSKQHL